MLMSLLLFFALALHADDRVCENPPSTMRTVELWKRCQSFRFLALYDFELSGVTSQSLGCYRCYFNRLKISGGPHALKLRESRLTRGSCEKANLNDIQAIGIKARGWRVKECTFERADFTTAYLPEARFEHVSFRDAKLNGVDFSAAEFVNVDFRGADLSQALLVRARFRDVKWDEKTKTPEGFQWPR